MYNFGFCTLNYLDDFGGAENKEDAFFAFSLLRSLLFKSGIEEAFDKACPPSEIMVFLGVLFNSRKMTMEVTEKRLAEIRLLVDIWLSKNTASLKEIQKLLGKLNFVGACVKSSRVFINRILNWLRDCYASNESHSANHMIPQEVKKDLLWWSRFLPLYNGISLIDYGEWSLVDEVFSSDSCLTGCGGICGNQYFHCVFPEFILQQNLSITCLEMLAVVVAVKLWCVRLKKKKIVVYCDNLSVCILLNTGKSKVEFLQKCLRELCLVTSLYEFQLKAVHIRSTENRVSDCLSRWHLDEKYRSEFYQQVPYTSMESITLDDTFFKFQYDW
jgi:hypothetical protein